MKRFSKTEFSRSALKCKFGVIPVTEFYESKYINDKPERWGVRRKDGQAFLSQQSMKFAK